MNISNEKITKFIKNILKDPLFLKHWEDPFYYHRHDDDNRLSVVLAGRRGKPYPYRGDSFMFIQDMYTGIMPFMVYSGEREKYPTKLESNLKQRERFISSGISQEGRNIFLADALCDFVRTTAHALFSQGVAFYEIVYKKDAKGNIESFDLEYLQPFYLIHFFNNYYQIIPWWEAKESRARVRIIKIPAEKILKIDFPKQFGGKKKICSVLKKLWQLSKETIPDFYMQTMKDNQNIGFNLNEFTKVKYLEIARLVKHLGWNQRQYSDNYITEYYSVVRFLRKKKLEAVIRQEIIFKLNKCLNRAPLNIGEKITMENLFSVQDVEKQEKLLKKGNIKFKDIFDAFKI
ncbi:MAG: hypothetical protein WCY05_08210 [Candidatus Omnitrophota bacterium]